MENNVKKVWFITGASGGFGKSFAEYAIQQGHNVVITARRLDKLDNIKAIVQHKLRL